MTAFKATARNVAEQSGNPLHSQEGATQLGITAPPIAGMTTIDYASAAITQSWRGEWPSRAGLDCRLINPIPAGAVIELDVVDLAVETRCTVRECGADERAPSAIISAWKTGFGLLPSWVADVDVPCELRPTKSLVPGLRLGGIELVADEDLNNAHLAEMASVHGITSLGPLRSGQFVVPGTVVDIANQVIMKNIATGSWVHTRSRLQFHDHLTVGERLVAKSFIAEVREHPNGLLVVVDVSLLRNHFVVLRMEHSAIL